MTIKDILLKVPTAIRNFLNEERDNGLEKIINDINIKLDNLDKKIDLKLEDLNQKIDINVIDDIRGEIVDFAEELRQNVHKSKVQFQHIFEIYDKYHSMGGNSYITNEFRYIKDTFNKIHNK